MAKSVNTLAFIYNSFNDPLFQNLVYSYLKSLSEQNYGRIHIVTFEQERYRLTRQEQNQVKAEMAQMGMYWHPLTFHTGSFLLLKKAWDLIRGLVLIAYLRVRFRLGVIFCFANVSAAMGVIISKLMAMKMIVYSYEPHARFQVELGLWSPTSLKFKILDRLERYAGRKAEYVLTGTKYMVEDLAPLRDDENVFRAPTAVDEEKFKFSKNGHDRVRSKYGFSEKSVFLYLGKFGDLYFTKEIPEIFAAIKAEVPDAVFLIVTSNDQQEIQEMFEKYLDAEDFVVTGNLTYDEVVEYISAADIGISGVPPSPSQKFRSPTKVAEYLLCGVPYITAVGVSEDDEVAREKEVGVVLNRFSSDEMNEQMDVLKNLLSENREARRQRCRGVGLEYRSRDRVIGILTSIYKGLQKR